nr:hypothetical protein [Tanacetum cinerariifolium]
MFLFEDPSTRNVLAVAEGYNNLYIYKPFSNPTPVKSASLPYLPILSSLTNKELVKGKEKRAGEEPIQESTKKQKVEDDKEKDELKQLTKTIPDEEEVAIDDIPLIYMLVEKKYPLTPPTLLMMLKKKLQIDYESEMAYQLCKLIKNELKK